MEKNFGKYDHFFLINYHFEKTVPWWMKRKNMHFYGTKVENRTNKTQRIMAKLDYNGLSNTVIQMAYKLSYIIFHYYICKKTFHFRISFGLECVRIFCFHIVKEKISLYKTFLCHQRRTLKRFLILPLHCWQFTRYISNSHFALIIFMSTMRTK